MLADRIYKDYVQALKAKEKKKVHFLSFLRAELQNKAIELKAKSLEDPQVIDVLKKQKKRLQESKEIIDKSGRPELVEDINNEIAIIAEYLPKPLAKDEVVKIITEAISESQASSMKDMGAVMKLSLEKLEGRADSKEVSQIVKEKLSNPS